MNRNKKVCFYLDMPLQHASTKMLKSMKRGITREKTDALINTIREKVPGLALRTTLITGFPGETQEDFEEMMEWVEKTRFDRLGCFTYSHEENTTAHKLEDDVPQETKQARANAIMELQSGISLELNEAKVGKTFQVLFDRAEGDYFIGRSQYDSPEVDNEVLVHKDDGYARIGDFANVEVTSAEEFDLFGKIVD
jgi:ribosomal protein S12 methylthiotransferase